MVLGPNGLPTRDSLKRVLKAVSVQSGKNSRIKAGYFVTDDDQAGRMNEYPLSCVARNDAPKREPYSIWNNNCGTSAEDVLEAGGVDLPLIADPRPNGRASVWQEEADFSIEYDPKTDQLKVDEAFFTVSKSELLAWKALPFWKRVFTKKPGK